jgi:hypothetical protein
MTGREAGLRIFKGFIMSRGFSLLVALCASLLMMAAPAGALTIAAQGKSAYCIVLPKTAPDSLKQAAQELQRDIALAGGANLVIQVEGAAAAGPIISLGNTSAARAARLSAAGMKDESFRIVTKGGNLYILGPDTPDGGWTDKNGVSHGTANGVYTFLEDYLDVRWLMPGELGRDVPGRSVIEINEIDRTEAPLFIWRRPTHIFDYADGPQTRAIIQWQTHQRVGEHNCSTRFSYDHSWVRTVRPELFKMHPDWFAMNADGKRIPPSGRRYKLETTNPEVVRYFAEQAIKTMKASNRPGPYSLSPSDGGGWSQSPASKALYDPSPAKLFDPEAPPGRPGMSSLVLKWYHDVSQVVAKEYPRGRLAGYIYADYLYPPTHAAMKLPDNFTPVIAPSFDYGYGLYRKQTQERFRYVMDSWAKVAPTDWFYYDLPNQLAKQYDPEVGGGNFPGSTGAVTPAAPEILNLIFSTLVRDHIKGAMIYGVPSWSNAAMSNYILAQMMWNPRLDARAVQRDWLVRAYGPEAGAVMGQFYQKLDGWFRDYYQQHENVSYFMTRGMLKDIYAAHYAEMEKLFAAARDLTKNQKQQARLDLIGDNLIVLQWRLRNAGFLPVEFASSLKRNDEQVISLITGPHKDFPLFPGYVPSGNYPGPNPPPWKVRMETGTGSGALGALSQLDSNSFLIYAARPTTVRILPRRVSQGAYFASYQITEASGRVLQSGIFEAGNAVEFSAKAQTAYYLHIPPRKPVHYELSIENAAVVQGQLKNGMLSLTRGDAPVLVLSARGDAPIGIVQSGEAVRIRKPFSGAAGKAALLGSGYYNDLQVIYSFDDGWRFRPDPVNDLLQHGVIEAGFDDSSWKPISALDWWQMQGFTDYHGAAWYRIKFNAAPLAAGRSARLYFGAVDGNATVYLNGKKVVEHVLGKDFKGWNQPFSKSVAHSLKAGENILAVKVTSKNDTSASGIFGGVSLLTAEPTGKK